MIGIRTAKAIVGGGLALSLFGAYHFAFVDTEPSKTIFYLACVLMSSLLWTHPETMVVRNFEEIDLSGLRTVDYIMLGAVVVLMSTSGLAILLG